MEEKKTKSFPWKNWLAAAAVLVFVLGGTALTRDSMPARSTARSTTTQSTASAKDTGDYYNGGARRMVAGGASNVMYDAAAEMPMMAAAYDDYDAPEMEEAMEEAAPAEGGAVRQEKIIRSASFTVKTTDYDTDLERLQSLAKEMGGRVEYMNTYGDASTGQTRSASLTLRIPSQRLDDFLSGVEGIGNVTSMTQEMQDVSDSYYDVQTRLETQRPDRDRIRHRRRPVLYRPLHLPAQILRRQGGLFHGERECQRSARHGNEAGHPGPAHQRRIPGFSGSRHGIPGGYGHLPGVCPALADRYRRGGAGCPPHRPESQKESKRKEGSLIL